METTSALQQFVMILAQEAINVLVPVLLTFAALGLNRLRALVKRYASAEKLALLNQIVSVVVQAAEKSALSGAIAKEGAAKKAFAIQEAQRILNERGLTGISAATIATYIESALQQGLENGFPVLEAIEGEPLATLELDGLGEVTEDTARALIVALQARLAQSPTKLSGVSPADSELPWKNGMSSPASDR